MMRWNGARPRRRNVFYQAPQSGEMQGWIYEFEGEDKEPEEEEMSAKSSRKARECNRFY